MSDIQAMIPATGWWARYERKHAASHLFDARTEVCFIPVIAWVMRNGMIEPVTQGSPLNPAIPGMKKTHKGMKFVGFEFDLVPSLNERH